MVLPVLNGCTLRRLQSHLQDHIPAAFILHIFTSLAHTFAALHRAGITHCDLKTDNIVLHFPNASDIPHEWRAEGHIHTFKDYPEVVLIDYGLAKHDERIHTSSNDATAGYVIEREKRLEVNDLVNLVQLLAGLQQTEFS